MSIRFLLACGVATTAVVWAAYGGAAGPFTQDAPQSRQPAQEVPQNAPRGSGPRMPAGTVRLVPVQIIDRNGFERPMVASTVLIPAGWQTRGGIIWNIQDHCGSGYNVDFTAVSPDGRKAVQFLPMETIRWNSMGVSGGMGCPTARIQNIQQYLQGLVQRIRPGARILDFRRRQDIAENFRQLNHTQPMPMGQIRTWVEVGEVLIGYRMNGVDMRESIAVGAVFSLTQMQGMYGTPPSAFLTVSTLPGFAMRAPNGQLDFRLAEAIRSSARPNPNWTARINHFNAQNAQVAARETQKRSNIIAQTGEDIRQMQQHSWDYQQAVQARTSREFSETIRGVETYSDPMSPSGTIQLSNQYGNAWRLNDGSYVLTDDPSFNPYAATGQDGVQLRRAP